MTLIEMHSHFNVYSVVEDLQLRDDEQPIKCTWANEAGRIGYFTSMGGKNADWQMRRVIRLEDRDLQPSVINLIYVNRSDVDMPIIEEWDDYVTRFFRPEQVLEISVSRTSGALIQYSINALGQKPHIGDRIHAPMQVLNSTRFINRPTDWHVKQVNTYYDGTYRFSPALSSPFRAIHLAICEEIPALAVA